ncbi:ribbon-helix-helix domain-containing protein [Hyphomicrobium sp.]|uniref:ribbon-helix-helix domain-containing protein n=1 Tax=Hyphomicrobium sp. TaxID=82 RepID=UPI002FE207C3
MTGPAARPVKRSFSIRGHRTSISLEEPFWEALKEAAARERVSLAGLIARIDESRGSAGLSSAVRVWILDDVRAAGAVVRYDGGNRD